MDSDPELPWKVIQRLFEDDPQMMVRHQIDSYNDFYGKSRTLIPKSLISGASCI
jgi:hypothetical protein